MTFSPSRSSAIARRPSTALLLAGGAVALLALTPIGYLIVRSSQAGHEAWRIFRNPATAEVLLNSLKLTGLVTLFSSLIGVPIAWLTQRTDLPGRNFWTLASIMPLAMPSYIMAYAWIALAGPGGLVPRWLHTSGHAGGWIYGLGGVTLVITLVNYPFVVLSTRAALARMDPGLEEAARGLGANRRRIFFRVILPQIRPGMTSGALLVALYTLSDFGTPALLRYTTFTRRIYLQYNSSFDRTGAAVTALVLTALTVLILALETVLRGRAKLHRTSPSVARRMGTARLGPWKWPAVGFCAAVLLFSAALPLLAMTLWTIEGMRNGQRLNLTAQAMINSTSAGLFAAVVAIAMALPVAMLAERYRGRVPALITGAAYLGNGLPGIVVALAFVFLSARVGWFYQTLPLLIMAYSIRFLPQAVGTLRTGLGQISPRVEEAGRGLGRGRFYVLTRVTLPLLAPGMLAGGALVFLTTIKELPITLLLHPTGFDTLVEEVWMAAEEGLFSQASPPALLLALISMLSVAVMLGQERRGSGAVVRPIDVAQEERQAA